MKDIKTQIKEVYKKYYIGLILLFITTVIAIINIRNNHYSDIYIKLVLSFAYGSIVAILIRNVLDRLKKNKLNYLLYLLIPILICTIYFYLLDSINIGSCGLKYIILLISTSILYFIIPFINNKKDSINYTYKVIISLLITILCFILLFVGISLIIFSVSLLFELNILEHVYMEIYMFLLGIVVPPIFLIAESKIESKEKYPNFINKIIIYIIYPMLSIYTLILYSYFIKVLIEFKWPANILGNLIIYYSLVSIGVLYFTYNKTFNKYIDKLIKIYPYVLIMPIIMMLITFIIRINNYGITELRYYGILCFIFVLISTIIMKTINKLKYIILTLSLLLILSSFGPLSAFNLSKNSQEKRLEQILIKNNMLKDNKIIPNSDINGEDRYRILNILEYFNNMHGFKDIEVLPKNFNMDKIEEVFGFYPAEIIEPEY
ncbi:MAG TPA: DUF4153 domain-containing protein [Bacilli bacterium]|nr:DUF4153 domain-containing protein [Bacilli bacterium]